MPTRITEAVIGRHEVMTFAAFPVLAMAASAFGGHAGGAVVAVEKLSSSGNSE